MRELIDSLPPETLAHTHRELLRTAARDTLSRLREDLTHGALPASRTALSTEAARRLIAHLETLSLPRLRSVINATGVVLHTNLGRAPLAQAVITDLALTSRLGSTVEYDLSTGTRGHRDHIVSPWITQLTRAEDTTVVNNCAAAVLLACTTFAQGRDVFVSRGELVEIGGGFRIPEVIESCGAHLVEVGTTNRTRITDYARAIDRSNTPGAVLKVHRSNFSLQGFVEDTSITELSTLTRTHNLPLLSDLGSGTLVDTSSLNLSREPTVTEHISHGADLVMFSADKLLGGPQAGLIVGRESLVSLCRRHPLSRALRPGTLVLSALETTLRLYAHGRALEEIPALAIIATPPETLHSRAVALCQKLSLHGLCNRVTASVISTTARIGAGTLPLEELPSFAVELRGVSPSNLAQRLRQSPLPIIARVTSNAVIIDLRCIDPSLIDTVAEATHNAINHCAQLAEPATTAHSSIFTDEESNA